MLADVVLIATTAEGVPPWLTYLGGVIGALIVTPIVAVLVRALARRLGVPDDTQQGTPEESPATRRGPEQSGQGAPAERYDAQMAAIERAFRLQDERIAEMQALQQRQAALLASVTAERDRLRWEYQQATGRPAPGPPPQWGPPPWEQPWESPSPGSTSSG